MDTKRGNLLKLCQRNLKGSAFKRYVSMLASLLRDHNHYDFLKPLSDSLRRRDFPELYRLADTLSTQKYGDATQHFVANQFALLIKKYPWPSNLLDLKPLENAVNAFRKSERRCGRINTKFSLLSNDRSKDRFGKEAARAKYWIRTIIGSRPNYRDVFERGDFGPGACLGVHGDATNYSAKFSAERWSVSPGAIHHGYATIRKNYHLWESLLPRGGRGYVSYDEEAAFAAYLSRIHVVANNKISFVPKTAKTHRAIAIEPMLNGLVQKGIDEVLRKKLLRVGIDLRDQGRNQELARLGSMNDSDDGFVTIDLKSASDSISIELVRYLLPDDWFRLLDRTRSHSYLLEEEVSLFNKFCSMGNGFCFPLETLIFAAACYAVDCGVPGSDFVVYGDDIIVRKKYGSRVLALLKHWGFTANSDKTFLEGPFRESCGTDWFGGKDVRPFTLDYALDSVQSIFKFLNLTRRSSMVEYFFHGVRDTVVTTLPEQLRFYRPFRGQADSGIDSLGDEFMYASTCSFRKGRWWWRELTSQPYVDFSTLEKTKAQHWLVSEALRGACSMPFGAYAGLPKITLRNRTQTRITREGYVATSNWLPPLSG